jgi:RNA polymerase sigma-70 factor (ECF subfamily)
VWVQPIPDHRIPAAAGDPADMLAHRETIRLAFIAALQHLRPHQRAVLILRDAHAFDVTAILTAAIALITAALVVSVLRNEAPQDSVCDVELSCGEPAFAKA